MAGTAKDVTTAFTSNPAGQVATLTRSNDLYAYTAATNLARSYSVNGLNQTTFYTGTGALLTHDANGNTTNDGTQAYTYTPENQLKTGPAESGLIYDGTGTLYRIGSENTVLRSVGGEIATEHDAATGVIENRYVTGAGVDEPLVWYGGSGTTDRHWLLADERGSIVAATDAAGNATINAYDEYGVPAATNVGRFGYTGQYWLPSLGLWYYKARMYEPSLGRFLQTDPIGYDGGINLYAYVGGDPVNLVDPSGLTRTVSICQTVGVGIDVPGGIDYGRSCYTLLIEERSISEARGGGGGGGGGSGGGKPCVRDDQGRCVPQNPKPPVCNQRRLDLANALAAAGDSFDSTGDKALIGAGGVAVAGAAFGATGIGLPAGVTAGAVAGALATAGTITKGVGSVLSVGAHVVAIGATGNYSLAGAAIFSGVAGILPFKLGPVASYLQDKVSGAASQMVGFGSIPASCPK